MQRLKDGYLAFQHAINQNKSRYLYPAAKQQQPHSMVISCCDSRVNPCQIFQAHAGEIFLFQNIAGHLPAPGSACSIQTSAALRFGIENLQVNNLIFLAHTDCAGLKAATENYNTLSPDLKQWLKDLKTLPTGDEISMLHAHLHQNTENALQHEFIAQQVQNQTLKIHQMIYNVEHGTVFIARNRNLTAF
jgi:carbonic anhydrase